MRKEKLIESGIRKILKKALKEYAISNSIANYRKNVSSLFNDVYDKIESPEEQKRFAQLTYEYLDNLDDIGNLNAGT